MDALGYSHVRSTLAAIMDKVCDDHAPVIITRANHRSVVMMSLEDYQALEETANLLRSPKNARRLLESIAELESTPDALTNPLLPAEMPATPRATGGRTQPPDDSGSRS